MDRNIHIRKKLCVEVPYSHNWLKVFKYLNFRKFYEII
jgi:hypothetical protein